MTSSTCLSHSRCKNVLRATALALALASPLAMAQSSQALTPATPAPSAIAQTTTSTATTAAAMENYRDLDWTGRAQSTAVLRQEAAASLAEGRRNCVNEPRGVERKTCLKLVNEDYKSMWARIKSASARR